jgi:rhodanese-related sulfurtransferase
MTIMISSAIGKQSNLKRTARAKDQYMFVDVREADELEKGKIDGAYAVRTANKKGKT